MEYVRLGRSGPKVSSIGLGMWQAGGDAWGADVRDRDCQAAMERAIELGVNLVDTAEAYGRGHSEEVVGRAVKAVGRDRVFLATKVLGDHLHADAIEKACKGSARRLGVRTIDLYQIHWPSSWEQVPLKETMRALERLRREGKIEHIGVSNFASRDLEEARSCLSRADVVSDQLQYNLLHREIEADALPYCTREGLGVLAWSPLAKGILTGKYGARRRPRDRVRGGGMLFKPSNLRASAPLVKAVRDIGRRHRKTAAQVALAWLTVRGNVIPIPGAKRPAQAEENAGAAGWPLRATEVRRLDRLSAQVRLDTF